MPYIKHEDRERLYDTLDPRTPGELNWLLTSACLDYLGPDPNYERYNAVVGALECCKLEFYRRAVAPYEDTKMRQNGDAY